MWERTAVEATPHEGHHPQYGSFASHSPVTDGRHVYAYFGSRGLYCYGLDGRLIWKRDLGQMNKFLQLKCPQFSWTLIRGESNVQGGGEMVRSRSVQVKASAGTEGARRATGVPADGAAGEAGPLAPGQRWSVGRKRDVVLRLLRGESLEALSREVGVEIYRLEDWRDRAVAGLERGVQARQGDLVAEALDAATRHIGELSMENELLRERARAAEQRRP